MSAYTDRFAEDAKDPVSAFYKYLWTRFDATTILSLLIKVGNRIDFSDRDKGIKANIASADCPEVMLTFGGFSRKGANSAEDVATISGTWTVASGELKFYNSVPYVTWLLNIFMGKIEYESCVGIDYEGIKIGSITLPEEIPFGFLDPETNRGLKGYASKLNFKAELYYNRSVYNDAV